MRNPFEVYTSITKDKTPKGLDWEESALDSQTYINEVYDSDRDKPTLRWLKVLMLACFLVAGVKIFSLQIIQGDNFRKLSESNRIRRQPLLAPRGIIRDRYGEVVAQNTPSYNLVAVPFDLPKEGLDEVIKKLSGVFGMAEEEIKAKLAGVDRASIEPVVIKPDISQQQSILFDTEASEFLGFSIQNIPVREYVQAPVFSHLLGYTGAVGPGEVDASVEDLYESYDFIGKSGVEIVYEKYLHGKNGQNLVEVDATGKLLNLLGEDAPSPGSTVELNIDKGLQEKLYGDLAKTNKAAAVAMDPRSGEVLALVSVPGFDNNLFAHGIKKEDYQKLLNDKNLPLFNRAIAGTYPPGSTVKPMVAAMALQQGTVDEDTVIVDRGVLVIPNQYNPSISYNFYGWDRDGLGPMTVRSAIARSSDIYFYIVAGGYPTSKIQGLGAEKLAEYYRRYNLGSLTGIDLVGEKPGLVPDPDWKQNYYKNDAILSKWYLGDTYHVGIGQGDLLSTPLQVAQWTSIVANNGVGFKPQVVNKVLDSRGKTILQNRPEVTVERFVDLENYKIVQEGMRETITEGSGRQLVTLPITSAGKTGTSQFDGSDPKRTHAWFTVYAPYENPEIVITILVEAGGEGHAAAVPVAKEALKWWAENRYGK